MTDHGGAASPRTFEHALVEAIAGQNLYHGRHGTTPAGYGAAAAILSVLREAGWMLLAAQEAPAPEPTPEEVREYRLDAIDPENARLNREEWLAHRRLAQEAPAPEGLRAALEAMRPLDDRYDGRYRAGYERFRSDLMDRLAATPPTPAEPRPHSIRDRIAEFDLTAARLGWPSRTPSNPPPTTPPPSNLPPPPARAEARPPEGLDAAALGRVLAGYRERDGRYTPPLTTTEPIRLMEPDEWAQEIAARLSAGGATKP